MISEIADTVCKYGETEAADRSPRFFALSLRIGTISVQFIPPFTPPSSDAILLPIDSAMGAAEEEKA